MNWAEIIIAFTIGGGFIKIVDAALNWYKTAKSDKKINSAKADIETIGVDVSKFDHYETLLKGYQKQNETMLHSLETHIQKLTEYQDIIIKLNSEMAGVEIELEKSKLYICKKNCDERET